MAEVESLTCPNCGASINLKDIQQGMTVCSFCGAALHIPEVSQPKEEPPVEINQRAVFVPQRSEEIHLPPAATKRRAAGCGGLVTVLILLGILAGAAVVIYQLAPGVAAINLRLWNEVTPLGSEETGPPPLIARMEISDSKNEQHQLVLLDGTTRKIIWKSSQLLSNETRNHLPVPGGSLIYFPDHTTLYAFKGSDGSVAWQQPLSNAVDTSCKDCVRLTEGQVVALSKDGMVQAYNAASGAPAWKVQLNNSPRELLLAAGKPAVVDEDRDKGNTLAIFDPVSGEVSQRLKGAPCQMAKKNVEINFDRIDTVYLSPDGQVAYIMRETYGSENVPCVQQVDLASGKILWETRPGKDQVWPSAWFAAKVLVAQQGIYFYESNVLSFIDAKTGALSAGAKEPRYREVTPLVAMDGRVVVMAIPDYDSSSKELWGITIPDMKKTWSYKMQAESIIDPWQVHLASNGLVVVQCLRTRKASVWEVLDPQTGASQGEKVISSSHYDFMNDAWTHNTAYLTIDATLFAVNIQTGKVQYTWP